MLVVYPDTDWQTFINDVEADSFMSKQRNDGGWATLTIEQKEMLLIETASMIRLCPNITLPEANEVDLVEGQAYLLLQATREDMTEYSANDRSITSETVDTLSVTYNDNKKQSANVIPPKAMMLLSQYGCTGGGGFKMVSLGRV